MLRPPSLFVMTLLGALSAPTIAQGCPGAGTFWKRDTLPDVPTGPLSVGVIVGMCEGESAGVVFEMPASMSVQKITQVVAPWGHGFGASGLTAALDVEVWDGVSFNGADVNMGTRVFSLSQVSSTNLQATTHALNTLDTSSYNIIVGAAAPTGSPPVRRFAITFRCDFNTVPDTCHGGSGVANFFTDAVSSSGSGCNPVITPARTSVMEIDGLGWRDPAVLSIGPFPLCPGYFRGIFCIRCCSEDAFPAFYNLHGAGCPNSLGVSGLIPTGTPRIGTTLFVVVNNMPLSLGLMITGVSDTFSGVIPLPADLTGLGLPNCFLRTSFDFTATLLGGGGSAVYTLAIPSLTGILGAQLYQQAFVFDPPLNPFGGTMSNSAHMQIGS